MPPRTLNDDRKADLANMLTTSEFAEAVAIYPPSGATRTVNVLVDDTTILQIEEQRDTDVKTLRILCLKDEAATDSAGNTVGGIAAPGLHLRLVRSGETLQQAYVYNQTIRETPFSWQLEFRREADQRAGFGL